MTLYITLPEQERGMLECVRERGEQTKGQTNKQKWEHWAWTQNQDLMAAILTFEQLTQPHARGVHSKMECIVDDDAITTGPYSIASPQQYSKLYLNPSTCSYRVNPCEQCLP